MVLIKRLFRVINDFQNLVDIRVALTYFSRKQISGGLLMRTILATFLTILMLLPVSAMGEILTIKQTVRQTFGGGQSADDARIYGIAKAKREALEKAGTYIESLTVVKSSQVEKDEILALTAGVLKAEVVSQKNYASDDAFGIEIIVNVVVDTSVLEERVKKQLQDRTHLTQLKDTQKRENELLQKVAQLEDENRKLTAKNESTEKLKKEFQQASDGLTAVDWVDKALALWDGDKYTDPKKAIEYLNNAIKLQPDLTGVYGMRGIAYYSLGQYQRAIEDYNEHIRLNPDLTGAYNIRGLAYYDLGHYQPAIEDFTKAIRLKPDYADTYNRWGAAYHELGQYKRAIEDYNEAIRLEPDLSIAYSMRGFLYAKLGQYPRAIEDYNEAIRLKPDNAITYVNRGNAYDELVQQQRAIEDYNEAIHLKPGYVNAYYNRGNTYAKLGQYQRAIEDYNEAIRLKPDLVAAYNNRGSAYLKYGNKKMGCHNALKACKLGSCNALDLAKGKGLCR
jgi:tetratricopeptide (TPR) repeat protein